MRAVFLSAFGPLWRFSLGQQLIHVFSDAIRLGENLRHDETAIPDRSEFVPERFHPFREIRVRADILKAPPHGEADDELLAGLKTSKPFLQFRTAWIANHHKGNAEQSKAFRSGLTKSVKLREKVERVRRTIRGCYVPGKSASSFD